MRYYGATKKLGITLGARDLEYHGFSDSDYAGSVEDRKSTSSYIFFLAGGPISWKTICQRSIALSSTKAEYYALTEAAKEAMWHQMLLDELKYTSTDIHLVTLHGDNTRALDLAKNPKYYSRVKYI